MAASNVTPLFNRHRELAVIKFGGALAEDDAIVRGIGEQIASLRRDKVQVVAVHGGGNQINERLKAAQIESRFENGLRVTSLDALAVCDEALGDLNLHIAGLFNEAGMNAVGMAGYVDHAVRARKLVEYTGAATGIDHAVFESMLAKRELPVLHSICQNEAIGSGLAGRLNVNADDAAAIIASGLGARLLLCSDIDGVKDADGKLIPELSVERARELIDKKVATGGMIPKLNAAISAAGIHEAVICNGKEEGGILKAYWGESGTLVRKVEMPAWRLSV